MTKRVTGQSPQFSRTIGQSMVFVAIGGAFFTILRDKVSSVVDWYFIVIGGVLIVIVLFMPRGLFGLRQLFSRRPRRAPA